MEKIINSIKAKINIIKIKSIIVDDEKHGRENLSGILREFCPEVELSGEAESVQAALKLIGESAPDLVFLDIEMPRENGFKLLEYLKDFSFEVIFVTAYDSYAIKAIRFSAADYILKPVNHNDLAAAVQKVAERIRHKQENQRMKQLFHNLSQPGNPRIGLPSGDRIEFKEVSEIIRCEGEGNYTHIWFEGGKHSLVAKTLVEFEDLLQDFGFVRAHKTHLVNLKYVDEYIKSRGILKLSDGNFIPVSRRRKETVLQCLKNIH
jgi:two-component system LytT family response regulator